MILNEIIVSIELGLIYGIVAMGVYMTFRVIDFPDLTCDGTFVFGAAISSIFIQSGLGPFSALFWAFCGGGLVGLCTGILNVRFGITDLLSGILIAFMLYSVNLHVMGGVPNIALIDMVAVFEDVGPLFTLLTFCSLIVLALCGLLMTDFGLALIVVGRNKIMAENGGLNVKFMIVVGLVIGNGVIALGGALFSQHEQFVDIGSGVGTVIIGFASVMIGERIIGCTSVLFRLISCVLGSIIYRIFIGIALHSEVIGFQTYDLNLITGLMIIVITSLSRKIR